MCLDRKDAILGEGTPYEEELVDEKRVGEPRKDKTNLNYCIVTENVDEMNLFFAGTFQVIKIWKHSFVKSFKYRPSTYVRFYDSVMIKL